MDLYFQNNNNLYNYQTINHISPTIYPNIINNSKMKENHPDYFQNTTIDNSNTNNNIFNMSNTYYNTSQKKYINSQNNEQINNNNKVQSNDINKLNFKLLESTTEDQEHPLRELQKGLKGNGWQSSRFSPFPEEVYIQFPQPVNIRRIDIITHEKNIPSQIKFFSYFPKKDEIVKNYHKVNYTYIGFIKMDTNERYNYKARESRKVYINSKALYLKIQMEKNYINEFNIFNQVGLMYIDFMGNYLPSTLNLPQLNKKRNIIMQNALRMNNIRDEDLENICGDKIDKLKELMEINIKNENYEECKQLKTKLDKIRQYGKKIYDLESQKKIAVTNEDFDKAMELRDLVEKMKINLKNIDINLNNNKFNTNNLLDIDNQMITNNNLNNISLMPKVNNNTINDSAIINESIDDNIIFEQSNSNNNSNKMNRNSLSNNNNNNNKNKGKESIVNHDEMVLPAVLKRIKNEPDNKEDEYGFVSKGELESIEPKLLKDFYLITNIIKEEGMQKIFSKQILWKEEGLNILLDNLTNILNYKEDNNPNLINIIITQIMKLVMIIIEEKHPSIIIKILDVLRNLFEYLKENNTKLNIDASTTDSILFKIKQKLGDVNPKVRAKSVSLYCFLLSLNFCDYNNLISELLEEELKHYDLKYIPKSNNLIMGKLDIFISVFTNFNEALTSKRTKIETFPSNLVIDYLIMNVSHNKSEIRKKTRFAISQFIRIFGAMKFKKKFEKIEERELIKLVSEIPELREIFPKLYSPSSGDLSNSGIGLEMNLGIRRKGSKTNLKNSNLNNNGENEKKNLSKNKKKKNCIPLPNIDKTDKNDNKENEKTNKEKENENNNSDKQSIKGNNKSTNHCDFCKETMKDGEILANHWIINCKMFTQCEKCFMNLEVQKLNSHKGKECKFKDQFKLCKNCNEYFLKEEYSKHLKEKCNLIRGFMKCPLCHKDIDIISNKNGFYLHLVKQGCSYQKRK